MGRLRDHWTRLWRKPGPVRAPVVWRVRIERERSAIGGLNDRLERTLLPGVPESALRAMQVALDELLTNVVMHAQQTAGPIELELVRTANSLDATISYIAAEFDPTSTQAADVTTVAASRIGGLGIQLVRSLMDDFRHEYVDGHNVLRLSKRC
ncbi:MAG: ATP-binding protein [Rudaea sp.]|nr:ATP-binding protein [Rudaea sp.]